MSKSTAFSTGRRYFCDRRCDGRARFFFQITGPGCNYDGKPSNTYKNCVNVTHPTDMVANIHGYKNNGSVSTYSHAHLKKYGVLFDEMFTVGQKVWFRTTPSGAPQLGQWDGSHPEAVVWAEGWIDEVLAVTPEKSLYRVRHNGHAAGVTLANFELVPDEIHTLTKEA